MNSIVEKFLFLEYIEYILYTIKSSYLKNKFRNQKVIIVLLLCYDPCILRFN